MVRNGFQREKRAPPTSGGCLVAIGFIIALAHSQAWPVSQRRLQLPQTRQEWRRQVVRKDDPDARHLATSLLRARSEGAYTEKTWKAVLFGLANDAIRHRNLAALRCLLVAGAPPGGWRKDQENLLLVAASYQEKEMVELLLDAGANPAAVSVRSGRTLLHAAAACGDATWMEVLARRGASWQVDNEGVCPLSVLKDATRNTTRPPSEVLVRRLESLSMAHALDEVAPPRPACRHRL